ncbi:MAG: SPFH/Band 7/PHB domain protein [Chloroflexi bacterium]|nr:SPFH/Band 7/PHB domain protein [Chloroflexota bacterium]
MAFFFSVVPEFERLVHFRFGRYIGLKGPGFIFPIWPIIDNTIRVGLREIFLDVEPQTCITKDNAPVSVDMLVYMKVVSPEDSVLKVENVIGAARGMAITTLRAVVGDITLDDVLAKRDEINKVMQAQLDAVTDRWGIKVTAVEIREIEPPRDILEAMSRQMSAERNRRAMVLEADGQREAAITVAEGEKQSAILKAEGDKQAAILGAQGDREASVLEAEGYSIALQKISDVAKGVDQNTMSLQYLETLKDMGASESTKWIFPMEFTNFIRPFVNAASNSDSDGRGRRDIPPE